LQRVPGYVRIYKIGKIGKMSFSGGRVYFSGIIPLKM
jgi:hypothetical protein